MGTTQILNVDKPKLYTYKVFMHNNQMLVVKAAYVGSTDGWGGKMVTFPINEKGEGETPLRIPIDQIQFIVTTELEDYFIKPDEV